MPIVSTPPVSIRKSGSGKLYGDVTVTEGSNITITQSGKDLTIASTASGGGITWNEVTGTSQSMSVDNGYITNNAALVTCTLPDTAALGKIVRVCGSGAGGWKIAQNASEIIHLGNVNTTTGTGGYIASTNRYDAVELVCIVANTEWCVVSAIGSLEYA